MNINPSLSSSSGVQAANPEPEAADASPRQGFFRQAVARVFKALVQCKSPSVSSTTDRARTLAINQASNQASNLVAAPATNPTVVQPEQAPLIGTGPATSLIQHQGHAHQAEPETETETAQPRQNPAVELDLNPLQKFSRAKNPESLPDPHQLLASLNLMTTEFNLRGVFTLCEMTQKHIFPMIDRVLNNSASAAILGTWLCKVFGQGQSQPRIDWMRHMDEPMLEEFSRLLGAPISSTDSTHSQRARQAPVENTLLIKRLFNDFSNVFMGNSQIKLTEQQKCDKDTALAVAAYASWQFAHLSPAMRADKAVVLTALKANGQNFRYVDSELKTVREVVMAAVSSDGSVLQDVDDVFRADKAVVTAAVKNNGWALEYASGELQADRDVVLQAVRRSGNALKIASPQWQADPEVVQAACSNNRRAFEFASDQLKGDRSFVLQLVNHAGASLEYASAELQNDEEVVKAAVSNNGYSLQYASKALQDNKQVVLAAVSQAPFALRDASDRLKDDTDVVLYAISGNEPYQIVFNSLLSIASKRLQSNRTVALAAVLKEPAEFFRLDPELKDDKQIVMAAVSSHKSAFRKASQRLQHDPDVVLAASKWKSPEPVQETFAEKLSKYANELAREDKSLLYPESSGLKGLDFNKLADNKKITTFIVSHKGEDLEGMTPQMRNDKDVVTAAYLQNPDSLKFASDDLKNDRAFIRELYMESQKHKHIEPD